MSYDSLQHHFACVDPFDKGYCIESFIFCRVSFAKAALLMYKMIVVRW